MKRIFGDRTQNGIWAALPGWLLMIALLFSLVSISLAEGFLFLAVISWALWLVKDKLVFRAPTFAIPLGVYMALSVASAVHSVNPGVSFRDLREMAVYLLVPVAYMSLRSLDDIRKANLAVFASAAASILYSFYHFLFRALPGERIKGFMGHYMTQGGLLVLFLSLALAMLLFERKKVRLLWGAGALAASAALLMTMTRSAWIGLAAALGVLVFLYRPKFLWAVPALLVLVFFVSPEPVRERARSIFTLRGFSNRMRVEYLKAGTRIIRDYPLLGTGPDTVDMVYQIPKYGLSEDAKRNVHLHNTEVQIAAERGIPALLAWIAFIGWILLGLVRILRNKDPGTYPLAAGGLAVLTALVVSGLFEYNFGDSEITILFLYLVTMPFAALRIVEGKTPPAPGKAA